MSVPRRCLDCGQLCEPTPAMNGRCTRCYRMAQRLRNHMRQHYLGDWPTIRRALIAARPWCEECRATSDLTVDHIVPVARGGTHARHNLRVLCRSCNSTKGGTDSVKKFTSWGPEHPVAPTNTLPTWIVSDSAGKAAG